MHGYRICPDVSGEPGEAHAVAGEDVAAWRGTLRPELIARRLALSAADRAAASERISAC